MAIYRSSRQRLYAGFAAGLRAFAFILDKWVLVALAIYFLSPTSLYLRLEYPRPMSGSSHYDPVCTYIGPVGLIELDWGPDCPVLALLDRRDLGASR